MSGPVETELPPSAFRRRELRLTLTTMTNRSPAMTEPGDLKGQVRTMDCHEMARRIKTSNNKHRLPFILLDCRGYLCYTESHIKGAVHIACTDRFNRKRVQNAGSVLDLVSTNNRRNKSHGGNNAIYHNGVNGKYRDVIVYDEGTSDLNLEAAWTNPISFVLVHLLQENRQPIYLNGGMKEFARLYSDLCDSSNSKKDLSIMPSSTIPSPLPPIALSPASSCYPMEASTPRCIDSYENEPPTQVLPFLYVGNARDAANIELLRRLKIRYVLSVTMTNPNCGHNNKCDHSNVTNGSCHVCSNNSNNRPSELRTKLIPVSDNLCENLAPYFDEACDFIEEARKSGWSILIHCQAGISRSPTIAIAYIMKHTKLTTLEAYAFVQRYRRIISPNLNFMGQLVEFESKLKSINNDASSNNVNNGGSTINVNNTSTSYSPTTSSPSSNIPPFFVSADSNSSTTTIPSDFQLTLEHPSLLSSSNTNTTTSASHLILPNFTMNVRSSSPTSPCSPTTSLPMILAD